MIIRRSMFMKAALLPLISGLCAQAVLAQGFINKKQDLPDASRFYMSRLQVQYVDDSPQVTRQPGAGPAQAGQAQQGAPVGLPKAGFQSYSPEVPQLSTNLPKVNNGVPPKLPPQRAQQPPRAARAQAAKLPSTKPKSVPTGPQAVDAYAPYKGYNPNSFGASGGSQGQTQTNVRGNVLHWARARRGY